VIAAGLVAAVLLGLAVVGVLAAVVGALRAATPVDAAHFVSAAGTVPPALLAAAVLVQRGLESGAVLAVLGLAVVAVTGGAVVAGFARVAAYERRASGRAS
jgi:hypothetical protein